jgi:hypothetical protein
MSQPDFASAIIDTVTTFLDTCPDIPEEWGIPGELDIQYGEKRALPARGADLPGVGITVTIGGRTYAVEVRPS